MSSEEMRMELESFVNAGLREGWRGWPLKDEALEGPRFSDRFGLAALSAWCSSRGSSTVSIGRQGVFAVSPLLS
ncbi:MAG: hypothetical protein A2Y77_08160 [Planctomycetes bacterium RBG_13_62_9]|nr:MAG: hypothetical protein A2Y77_08160 [Planctomycetes bacterium RBG_13_62_9]